MAVLPKRSPSAGPARSVCTRRRPSHCASFHNLNGAEPDGSIREHDLHPAARDWSRGAASCKQPEGSGGRAAVRLPAASRFVCPNNGRFARCATDGAGGSETGRPAGTPEENLDAIKTQGCSGMFNIRSCTHIALPNTFIRKMSARKMTLQGLD